MKHVIVVLFILSMTTASESATGDISVISNNPNITELSWYGCSIAANYPDFWIASSADPFNPCSIYHFTRDGVAGVLVDRCRVMCSGAPPYPNSMAAKNGRLAISQFYPSSSSYAVSVYSQFTRAKLYTILSPTMGASFGRALDFHVSNLIVGSPEDALKGQIHVFYASTGVFIRTMYNPLLNSGNAFGANVLGGDDRFIALDLSRGLYVYDNDCSETARFLDITGCSFNDVAIDGNYIATIDNSGKISAYNARTGTNLWNIQLPSETNGFGVSSMSISGDLLAVGVPYCRVNTVDKVGTVDIIRISTGGLISHVVNPVFATRPDLAAYSMFGYRVVKYGSDFLVGAPGLNLAVNLPTKGIVYKLQGDQITNVGNWQDYE